MVRYILDASTYSFDVRVIPLEQFRADFIGTSRTTNMHRKESEVGPCSQRRRPCQPSLRSEDGATSIADLAALSIEKASEAEAAQFSQDQASFGYRG